MEFLLIVMLTVSSYFDSTTSDSCVSTVQSSEEFKPWKIPYLPLTIQPVSYDLHLFPDFYYNASTFSGQIVIRFKVVSDTNTILVHARNLNITLTTLGTCLGTMNVNRTFQYNEYFVVQTNGIMEASDCASAMVLRFNGNLTVFIEGSSQSNLGFYKGRYVNDRTRKERSVLSIYSRTTTFEPN